MKIILIISLFVLQSLNAYNEHRQGLFGGLGIGIASSKDLYETNRYYGLTIPWEIGYGINENILIYFSMEGAIRIEEAIVIVESVSGLGLSYYMNNNSYIKTTIGPSEIRYLSIYGAGTLNGLGFSLGWGQTLSKTSSIELTYLGLFFDKIQKLGYSIPINRSSNTISVIYKHRWF